MRWVWVALFLCVGVAILGVEVVDRRSSAVESSVRRYASAVSTGDLDAAMAEIAPSERGRWRDWVAGQLGNVYDVTGIAVRVHGVLGGPFEVTVNMDVNRGYEDEFYQPTSRVGVTAEAGRDYLAMPLLATTP